MSDIWQSRNAGPREGRHSRGGSVDIGFVVAETLCVVVAEIEPLKGLFRQRQRDVTTRQTVGSSAAGEPSEGPRTELCLIAFVE